MSVLANEDLVLANAMILNRPLTHQMGIEAYPYIRSTSPEYLDHLDICATLYPREIKVTLDDDGYVGASGVHTGFDSFRTVPGVGMTPVTYLPVDNALLRAELGLPIKWLTERDRLIYRKLFDLALCSWHVVDLKVAQNSKSGLPFLEYDVLKKMEMISFILEDAKRFKQVLDMSLQMKLDRLLKDLRYVIGYIHNVRWQVDHIGKKRFVADLEYALSGGKRGALLEASKAVKLHGKDYPKFSAARLRLVQGLSLLPAAMEQIKFSGHMKHMFKAWPKTFHHVSVQEILDSLDPGEEIEAGDVSQYDSTVPWFMFEEFLSVMADYYSPAEVHHTRISLQAPYVTPPVAQGEKVQWVGNMTNPADFRISAGIRSGHPSVSCLGKLFKTGDALCVFDRMNGDVLERMEEYLRWERDLKIANSGDDEWDIMPSRRVSEYEQFRFYKEGEQYKHGYFKIEREAGKGFIGKIVQRTRGDNRTRKALPKIHSRFNKQFLNERGVDSKLRKKWPIGHYARKVLYKENPCYNVATQIDDYAWKKSGLESKYGSLDYIVDRELKMMTGGARPETEADFMVMANPDFIHYGLADDSDVSQGVMDSICKKIRHEGWIDNFKSQYGGIIYG